MAANDYLTRSLAVLAELMGGIPDDFTPEWFDQAIAAADAKGANGCPILSELRFIQENGDRCARWMRAQGLERARFIGPFRQNPFTRGQTVRIKKGSTVRHRGRITIAKIDYKIRIHSAGQGFTHEDHGPIVCNPTITWPGTGGYWSDLDLSKSPLPELVAAPTPASL